MSENPKIHELLAPDTGRGHAAMLQLRPRVGDAAEFAARVDGELRSQGYRLVGVFAHPDDAQAAAVAGFRVLEMLAWGRVLYVDDLSTAPAARGRGYAGMLLDWLLEEARRLGADQLHLDSGVGPEREDAHRLYFNRRMRITSYHFAREVPRPPASG